MLEPVWCNLGSTCWRLIMPRCKEKELCNYTHTTLIYTEVCCSRLQIRWTGFWIYQYKVQQTTVEHREDDRGLGSLLFIINEQVLVDLLMHDIDMGMNMTLIWHLKSGINRVIIQQVLTLPCQLTTHTSNMPGISLSSVAVEILEFYHNSY